MFYHCYVSLLFQTNLPVFKVKESSVRRRYSDFDWLRGELERDSKVRTWFHLTPKKDNSFQELHDIIDVVTGLCHWEVNFWAFFCFGGKLSAGQLLIFRGHVTAVTYLQFSV